LTKIIRVQMKCLDFWDVTICTDRYSADDLMKSHCSVRVVRMWCRIRTNPVHRCFMDPEGLNYGNLLVIIIPELAS
jgi:hypothetical protein